MNMTVDKSRKNRRVGKVNDQCARRHLSRKVRELSNRLNSVVLKPDHLVCGIAPGAYIQDLPRLHSNHTRRFSLLCAERQRKKNQQSKNCKLLHLTLPPSPDMVDWTAQGRGDSQSVDGW